MKALIQRRLSGRLRGRGRLLFHFALTKEQSILEFAGLKII